MYQDWMKHYNEIVFGENKLANQDEEKKGESKN